MPRIILEYDETVCGTRVSFVLIDGERAIGDEGQAMSLLTTAGEHQDGEYHVPQTAETMEAVALLARYMQRFHDLEDRRREEHEHALRVEEMLEQQRTTMEEHRT